MKPAGRPVVGERERRRVVAEGDAERLVLPNFVESSGAADPRAKAATAAANDNAPSHPIELMRSPLEILADYGPFAAGSE